MKFNSILAACVVVSLALLSCGGGGHKKDYQIGGTVSGLSGTVVLQNNGADDLSLSANGTFTFETALDDGAAYAVTVRTQPAGQLCSVANGTGTIDGEDVTDVSVTCASGFFTVGGTVSGLSGTVVLQNNGADDLTVNANGAFTFQTPLDDGESYAVTIRTQPATQTCSVANGTGTVNGADVTSVSVTCSSDTYAVGGTVTGLSGTVVLQNNGADDLSLTANGPFVFATMLADGSAYDVTVLTQPAGQFCSMANGSGTIDGADVGDVEVTCGESGVPDETFGTDGVVIHEVDGDSEPFMAMDSTGRIVLAGERITLDADLNHNMLIRMFTEDGELDTTFGTDGIVTWDGTEGVNCEDKANTVTFDGTDRVVAAGYSVCGSDSSMVIWRYNADGSPDTSFDEDGVVMHAVASSSFFAYGVTVDADGRVLATGVVVDAAFERDLIVLRYEPDGTPDATFGTGGYASFDNVAEGGGWDEGYGIIVDGSGRILVTGHSDGDPDAPASFDMVILGLEEDGTLDTTFDGDGIVSHHNAAGGDGWDTGWDIALDGSGRILVTGSSMSPDLDDDMVIWRYTSDGTLDATFGTGGVVVHDSAAGANGSDVGYALVVDGEGRILVTGNSDSDPAPSPTGDDYDMATWRFSADGTLDTAFCGDGIYTYHGTVGAFNRDAGTSIAIDRQGRIVVGGGASNGSNEDGAIWRFNP
jgi:uncharacterized delta-60 repeat protein